MVIIVKCNNPHNTPLIYKSYLFNRIMVQMLLDLPKELNILLRRYVMETDKKNKEKAITFILTNFLNEYYKDANKNK